MDRLERYGIDWVYDALCDGKTLGAIARDCCVSAKALLDWISTDPVRQQRFEEIRQLMALEHGQNSDTDPL